MIKKKVNLDEDKQIAFEIQQKELDTLLKQGEYSSDVKQVILEDKDFQDNLDKDIKKFLIPKLRSASYRWKPRSEAIKAARKERGIYICNICKCEMRNGEFTLDHIEPAIDIKEGFKDWDTFIKRLFVPKEGWQLLCNACDEIKTQTEVQIRKLYRNKRKEENKN